MNNLRSKSLSIIQDALVPNTAHFKNRVHILACVVLGIMIMLISRYAYLAILPSEMRTRLRSQAMRQFETEIMLAPPRAQITDRNGHPLAVSILQPSVFIIPKRIPDDITEQRDLARQLRMPFSQISELARSKKNRAWIKRQITHDQLAQLGDLTPWRDLIGVVDEPKRYYPEKELAAHLLGFVGVDNIGLEGIEYTYNDRLKGESVTAKVTRDARGRLTIITPNGAVRPEPSNPPLRLTIDMSIQSFAESALRDGVSKAHAKGGSAVVMDVDTGEVLAIASYPTFDLNSPNSEPGQNHRFRAIADALELGSVVKPIFISRALDKKILSANDRIYCENGRMQIPGGAIRDTHQHGWLTAAEIIKVSSNICTYKIIQKLGRSAFRDAIVQSGLGRNPGTGLPGEWAGHISPPNTWREMRFANMAFGQGIAISPLQLTQAYCTIAGGGRNTGVRLLATDSAVAQPAFVGPELHYISAATSKLVTKMMTGVVEEEGGTGQLAMIPGITVAGKTGTAQKFDQITHQYSERIASFVGVIPAEKPKLAIAIVIDEPSVRPAYGGALAGPVFSEVGFKTMNYLNALGVLALQSDESTNQDSDSSLAQRTKKTQ